MSKQWRTLVGLFAVLAMLTAGCASREGSAADPGPAASEQAGGEGEAVSGTIEVDGSSTVEPLTGAIYEEYSVEQPDVAVNVGVSGTGGGFERFCAGETDISNASRAIKDEEIALCEEEGIEYVELRVGTDALTMVTSPETDFVTCLTTEEVEKIFGPDNPAKTWADVNSEFPDEKLEVFAPGQDSGTYDFMVEDVLDLEASREDYAASEDDNIIAQGVIGTPGSWGFFGFAFFQESADQLKAIEYDAGDGCVAPSVETAQDGSYQLTRPLYIYVKKDSLERPEVENFTTYYLDNVGGIIEDVGYVPVADADLEEAKSTLTEALGS